MGLNQKQIEAVISLPGPKRFRHFVKVVSDRQKVWGLFRDGWAQAATDDGKIVFPVWPEKEYAEIAAVEVWSGYEAREIGLSDFMDNFLPGFEEDGTLPGVFFVGPGNGIVPSVNDLRSALMDELSNY